METHAPMLAEKVRFLLAQELVTQAALARACGVRPQAITGWRKTGRIAKPHLPIIAELAGVTVDWLISDEPPEEEKVIAMRAPKPRWPFKAVTWARYHALSREDKADLERRIERIVNGYEATDGNGDPRKSPAGHAAARVYILNNYRRRNVD